MVILPSIHETLDTILQTSSNFTKEFIKQRLEQYDLDIYCFIDKRRFRLISIRERTLLTSYGIVKYKRRYYYDNLEDNYVYLLDNQLEIPPNVRMSNELILKILDLASIMTYKEVGQHLSNEFELSKFTIYKVIHDSFIEAIYSNEINRNGLKIHLQLDEKFIGITSATVKVRYYTATLFAGKKTIGKNKYQLLNKTVLSSFNLEKLKERINYHLKERYKVCLDEEIYVSGDLAQYIQNFKESITVCETRYVPDKFHVYKAIYDALPNVYVDDYSLNQEAFQKYISKELSKFDDNKETRKIIKLIKSNPRCFEPYLSKEYLGCSQEGQNSHIYAPRFGKYANRFNTITIEKLSLVREARTMNSQVRIVLIKRKIPKKVDIGIVEYDASASFKDYLNTSRMKYETKQMFDALRYGKH